MKKILFTILMACGLLQAEKKIPIRRFSEGDLQVIRTKMHFSTMIMLPEGEEASAIIGLVGSDTGFGVEIRLNKAPLNENAMAAWLERLIGYPVGYAPLPAFV